MFFWVVWGPKICRELTCYLFSHFVFVICACCLLFGCVCAEKISFFYFFCDLFVCVCQKKKCFAIFFCIAFWKVCVAPPPPRRFSACPAPHLRLQETVACIQRDMGSMGQMRADLEVDIARLREVATGGPGRGWSRRVKLKEQNVFKDQFGPRAQ